MSRERQPGELPQGLGLPEPDHPAWQMVNVFPDNIFGEQAWHAHQRELPRLLNNARGQWVAYHGEQCLGVSPTHLRLYEECLARGYSSEELVICQIEPIEDQESFGMSVCWSDEGGSPARA